jgi:hypothetical protein
VSLGVTLLDASATSVTHSSSGTLLSSKTSASFTPPANSKLYLFSWAQSSGTPSGTYNAPTNTGGLAFTAIKGPTGLWGSFNDQDALWEADVGASPSAMTVTVNLTHGAWPALIVLAVTGNSPRIKSGQLVRGQILGGGTGLCPVGPLPVAPTPGNLVVCFKGANKDTGTDIPKVANAGFSKLFTTPTGAFFEVAGADSCIDFTGAGWNGSATNYPNTGDVQDDCMSIVAEFEEAGVPSVFLTESGLVLLTESGVPVLAG